jgi:hypothetical protein
MKRMKMKSKSSKKLFTRTAQKVHPKNGFNRSGAPMRGGIRL